MRNLVPVLAGWMLTFGLLARPAAALEFDDGGVHVVDYPIIVEDVNVRNSTTVNVVSGGQIWRMMQVYDDSQVNVCGGEFLDWLGGNDTARISLSGDGIVEYLHASEDSEFTILGGTIRNNVRTGDTARGTFTGGDVLGDVGALGGSLLSVEGGTFDRKVWAKDNARLAISGGVFVGGEIIPGLGLFEESLELGLNATGSISGGLFLDEVGAGNYTSLNVSGGEFRGLLYATNLAEVHIRGGTFDGALRSHGSAVMLVYGSSFNYPFGLIPESSGRLQGVLANGDPIDVEFEHDYPPPGGGVIMLVEQVPEPCTLILLGVGAVVLLAYRCRVRKRRGQ